MTLLKVEFHRFWTFFQFVSITTVIMQNTHVPFTPILDKKLRVFVLSLSLTKTATVETIRLYWKNSLFSFICFSASWTQSSKQMSILGNPAKMPHIFMVLSVNSSWIKVKKLYKSGFCLCIKIFTPLSTL